jgi:O-antigen/teichoic acid export membrane protein
MQRFLKVPLAFLTPFLDWFNINLANTFSARLSLLILGSYIILGTIFGLINSLYITVGNFVKAKILSNLREFLLMVFIGIVVFSGGKFISVSLVYLLLLLIFILFVYIDNLKNNPEINFKKTKIDWKLGKSFILPGFMFMLIPLSNMIYLQGSVLVISSILGSVAVSTFTVHRTLANLIQRFTNVIDPAIKPELTAGEARGDYPKIQLIHKFFNKLILFISISLSSILFFVGKDLMNLWTNGEIAFDKNLWIVFIILVPVLAFWSFNSSFQEATNKYGKLAIARISTTILGLILAVLLGKQFGLIGVLIGFLISELLIDFWYIPYNTLEIIKASKRKFVITMFGVIPMIVLQILSGWAVAIFIGNIWLKIILEGIIVVGIGILYVYYIWFDKEEKDVANSFILRTKRKLFKTN